VVRALQRQAVDRGRHEREKAGLLLAPSQAENALNVRKLGVKRQVRVAAHVSAQVIQDSASKLLKFSDQSAFAGLLLRVADEHLSSAQANF
jgi:hypothetical protein